MTSAHVLYIPLILFLGMAIGFALGRGASRGDEVAAERRRAARSSRIDALRSELAGRSGGSDAAGTAAPAEASEEESR